MELFNVVNKDSHQYAVVVSIPHSGTFVPKNIRSSMLPDAILTNSDWFLKELYAFLSDMNITVLSSNISRYVVDLNRDKLDCMSGNDFWTEPVHTHNTFRKPIYARPLSFVEVKERIERYYEPFHAALTNLIESKLKNFDKILLLNLHSFCVDFVIGADEDIILSNYDNKSSTQYSIEVLRCALAEQGYKVGINTIRGRYILKHYKQIFGEKIDCIQMELRYSQYIGNRYFGEEELHNWDELLFASAQVKLQNAFTTFLKNWRNSKELVKQRKLHISQY